MDRNQKLIERIIESLDELLPNHVTATARLSEQFKDCLIINAGGVQDVAQYARILRLAVNTEECHEVLDYVADQALVCISIDHVETAINELFPDRFIEPEE